MECVSPYALTCVDCNYYHMKLVIAEKPSVAKSIADVLGSRTKKDGYIEGGSYIVTWCIGHLVGLATPEMYDEKYAKVFKQ